MLETVVFHSASSLSLLGFRMYTLPLKGWQRPLFFYDPLEDTENSTVLPIYNEKGFLPL